MNNNITEYKIISIISLLNEKFNELYYKHTINELKKANIHIDDYSKLNMHNPYSYYLNGHCPSYSRILCEIFKDKANIVVYYNEGHVVTKIDDHFYDVRGQVDDLIDKTFLSVDKPEDMMYIDLYFGIKDSLEKPIEKDLISIGKTELNRIQEFKDNRKK